MMQPNNGIFISTWYDDPQDTALFDLVPLLEELVVTRVRVPDILSKYREQIPCWAGFGRWDLGDSAYDDTPPLQVQQELPPQPRQPPMSSAGQYQGAPAEPSRMAGPGTAPAPAYSSIYSQSPAQSYGYPDQAQQPLVPQSSAQQPQQQMQTRAAPTFSAGSGAMQYVPQQQQQQPQQQQQQQQPPQSQARPAFGGIAGPYQAALSQPMSRR